MINNNDIFQQKPTIELILKGDKCELYRLDDEQYYFLSQNSFFVRANMYILMLAEKHFQKQNQTLNLPKLYAILTELAGKSSKLHHKSKSSFCFPFLIKIEKKDKELNNYLLILSDWGGYFDFRFKRLIGEDKKYANVEQDVTMEPFEDEFSAEEIDYFVFYFYRCLVCYFEKVYQANHENFFKYVDRYLILYGYTDGEFWEKHYEEYDYYTQRLDELKLKYPEN